MMHIHIDEDESETLALLKIWEQQASFSLITPVEM